MLALRRGVVLSAGDMVFIDNSHRAFQNSDVTVFFTEVLPALPAGVAYGIHDIFLPDDYPAGWSDRFYNEQYLLAAAAQVPRLRQPLQCIDDHCGLVRRDGAAGQDR